MIICHFAPIYVSKLDFRTISFALGMSISSYPYIRLLIVSGLCFKKKNEQNINTTQQAFAKFYTTRFSGCRFPKLHSGIPRTFSY